MNILVYGNDWENSLGRMVYRAFDELGNRVRFVNDIDHTWFSFQKTRGSKDCKVDLLKEAKDFLPDLIFIIKGSELDRKFLNKLSEFTDCLINWYPDNPFEKGSEPIRDENFLDAVQAYDIILTWSSQLIPKLEEEGAGKVERLPFAYDPKFHSPSEAVPEYSCDVAFIGGWDKKRQHHLERLLDFDLQVRGDAWRWRTFNLRLQRKIKGSTVKGPEYGKAISSAKIVINILRDQNENVEGHNMRTFEVPATQSLQVTTRTSGQKEFFPEGDSCVMFDNEDELREKISYYLQNEEERNNVAMSGYDKVRDHTYKSRMEHFIENIL